MRTVWRKDHGNLTLGVQVDYCGGQECRIEIVRIRSNVPAGEERIVEFEPVMGDLAGMGRRR